MRGQERRVGVLMSRLTLSYRYCYPSTRFGQAPNPSAITPASTAPVATTTSKPGSAAASKAGMVGTLAAVGLALIASKLLV